MFGKKLIAFGDLHLDREALEVILAEARALDIDSALNLGDEGLRDEGPGEVLDSMYAAMAGYVAEKPGRELVCCVGNNTEVAPPLHGYYSKLQRYLNILPAICYLANLAKVQKLSRFAITLVMILREKKQGAWFFGKAT